MKNNILRAVKRALMVAAASYVVVTVIFNLMSVKTELSSDAKEVTTPVVPFPAPQSVAKVTDKKKRIKSLKINPNRTLYIFTEVDERTEMLAPQIGKLSRSSPNEPIVILIDSPGGSVFSGEKVVSAIEAAKADVYTVCMGVCASMAAIIHQYGTKRLAADRAVLMFHDAAGMMGGRVNEMLSALGMIRRKLDKTNHYIANRSKVSYEQLIYLEANNFWIDSEDAMEKGLVDDLVVIEE